MIASKGYILLLLLFLSELHTGVVCDVSEINKSSSSTDDDAVKNVALGKETLQSTLSMYNSDLVVDGNTDQNLANGSCINIEKKGESWWQVDLGDIYTIFNVKVYLADIIVDENDCYETSRTYQGMANTTESGIPCLHWNIRHPKMPTFYHIALFKVNSKDENYCRGIYPMYTYCKYHGTDTEKAKECGGMIEKPWCYTTNPDILWEYCAVEKCETGGIRDLILKIGTRQSSMGKPDFIETSDLSRNIRDFILHDNPQARYVQFHQDGTRDYYPLCEVEVYGVLDDAVNVALDKPVEMSSSSGQFDPEYAVDGYRNMDSYFETAKEVNPWWRVDLSGIYVVFLVRLFSRLDCCSHKDHGTLLQLGASLDSISNVSFVEGQSDAIQSIILPTNTTARFVELIQTGEDSNSFRLYEVEVLGKKAECSPSPCENGGNCSVIHCVESECRNYFCTCANGYGSVHCNLRTYNVANGKQSELSSVQYKNWHPNNALDGDNNQNVLDGATCVSTQKEIKPYLIVDLGDQFNITDVKVFLRSDCCTDNSIDVDLLVLMNSWTKVFRYTDTVIKPRIAFLIYPHVATQYIKVIAKEDEPVFLQICEVEVNAIYQEGRSSNTMIASPPLVAKEQKIPYIQMRFSLSDEYSEVVLSESSFLNSVRQGLSLQTGYSINSFTNMQLERDPFRVSLQLHSKEENVTLHEKFKKVDTLIRFGVLEIENENGQLLKITAGSLQHHVMYNGVKGTAPEIIFCTILQMVVVFAVGIA